MTKILQPEDFGPMLAQLEARIAVLESQPARALEIKDNTGLTRVRAGVAPQSNSLAVFDSLGNSVLDTTGLQQVVANIGGVGVPSLQPAQPFTTTATNHPITNDTFTLTRTGSVLLLAMVDFFTNGGTANYGYTRIAVFNSSSVLVGASKECTHTNGSGVSSVTPYLLFRNVPADTYMVWLQYRLDAGATTTWQLASAQWNAFQLGG